MIDTLVSKVRDFLLRWIIFILLFLGVALTLAGHFDIFFEEEWANLIESVGIAVLSSGIFAAVLKSIQFSGIFREEIEKVILSDEYLQRRKDLPELWRRVSKTLYEKRFPLISDDLENIVLEKYLPTGETYYYEDLSVEVIVEEFDGEFVTLNESFSFQIVPSSKDEKIELFQRVALDVGSEDNSKTSYALTSFEVNGKEYLSEDVIGSDGNGYDEVGKPQRQIELRVNLEGKEKYLCKKVERKVYSIKNDPYKAVRMGHITKGLELSVDFSGCENFDVDFLSLGTPYEYKTKMEKSRKVLVKTYEKGLILPNQGYVLIFKPSNE